MSTVPEASLLVSKPKVYTGDGAVGPLIIGGKARSKIGHFRVFHPNRF